MLMLLRVSTSESMKPCLVSTIVTPLVLTFVTCLLAALFITDLYYFVCPHLSPIFYHLFVEQVPIQLLVVLGVLGTQETSCILIAGLLERDHLQPLLP